MSDIKRLAAVAILVFALLACALASAASAAENLMVGTPGSDSLSGTPARDVIYAGSGDDRITDVGNGDVVGAGSGNDVVSTQPAVTVTGVRIEANVGHDTIVGRARESRVNADGGNDVIQIDGCGNQVVAGTGNDRYENPAACRGANLGSATMGPGSDLIRLGGSMAVTVHGGNGADRATAAPSVARSPADDGADLIELAALSARNDLDGGPGRDHARLQRTSIATTCGRIERVTDPADRPRACS